MTNQTDRSVGMWEKMSNLNRPKQFDASREEFVTAAREVFSQKGYHAASVDDIVARAGRSKGGFYHHFQSKDQLFREVFETALSGTLDRLQEGIRSGAGIREVLNHLIEKSAPLMKDPESVRGTVDFILQSIHNEESRLMIKTLHDRLADTLADLFKAGAERGEISSEFDFRNLADTLISSGRGICVTMVVCGETHRIPELLHTLNAVTFSGLKGN